MLAPAQLVMLAEGEDEERPELGAMVKRIFKIQWLSCELPEARVESGSPG